MCVKGATPHWSLRTPLTSPLLYLVLDGVCYMYMYMYMLYISPELHTRTGTRTVL